MNSNQIGQFAYARPFEPFVMWLVDGREFKVLQPNFIAVGDHALGVWFLHPSGELELIDVELVVSMKTINSVDSEEYIR